MHVVTVFDYYESWTKHSFSKKRANTSSVVLSINTSLKGTRTHWRDGLPWVGGPGKHETNLEWCNRKKRLKNPGHISRGHRSLPEGSPWPKQRQHEHQRIGFLLTRGVEVLSMWQEQPKSEWRRVSFLTVQCQIVLGEATMASELSSRDHMQGGSCAVQILTLVPTKSLSAFWSSLGTCIVFIVMCIVSFSLKSSLVIPYWSSV